MVIFYFQFPLSVFTQPKLQGRPSRISHVLTTIVEMRLQQLPINIYQCEHQSAWCHSSSFFESLFFFFFKILCGQFTSFHLFIYLFLAVLCPRFCARVFSICGKWGPLFIAAHGPLIITASLVAEHRIQTRRLSNCGSRAQLLRSMWDLPRPGLEPVSPALAGRFSTTVPPGKPWITFLI